MNRSDSLLTVLAALSGAVAIMAGAFGAHGAEDKAAEWLRTGGQYQLVHAVAILIVVRMQVRVAGWLFFFGSAIFSGSLYLMSLGMPRWLGAITPIGGLLIIFGWMWLAWSAFRARP